MFIFEIFNIFYATDDLVWLTSSVWNIVFKKKFENFNWNWFSLLLYQELLLESIKLKVHNLQQLLLLIFKIIFVFF